MPLRQVTGGMLSRHGLQQRIAELERDLMVVRPRNVSVNRSSHRENRLFVGSERPTSTITKIT